MRPPPRLVARLAARPGAALVAGLVLLAGLGVTADLTAPAPAPAAPVGSAARPEVPVAQATGVCPDPAADDKTASLLSVAAPGLPEGTDGPAVAAGGAGFAPLTRRRAAGSAGSDGAVGAVGATSR